MVWVGGLDSWDPLMKGSYYDVSLESQTTGPQTTNLPLPPPRKTNMTIKNLPFEDVFPILNIGIFQPVMLVFRCVTPWKINMEPNIYHPLEKENPLPCTSIIAFHVNSSWWFPIFLIFTPIWGDDPIWLIFFSYFSKGLKPPTSCVPS